MGTNKYASQKGMTSYGTRRHLYDSKVAMDNPMDQSTISLQMGTNKGASQVRTEPEILHRSPWGNRDPDGHTLTKSQFK